MFFAGTENGHRAEIGRESRTKPKGLSRFFQSLCCCFAPQRDYGERGYCTLHDLREWWVLWLSGCVQLDIRPSQIVGFRYSIGSQKMNFRTIPIAEKCGCNGRPGEDKRGAGENGTVAHTITPIHPSPSPQEANHRTNIITQVRDEREGRECSLTRPHSLVYQLFSEGVKVSELFQVVQSTDDITPSNNPITQITPDGTEIFLY